MPRVAQQPRANARPALGHSPIKSSLSIPLNDDREEKAVRLQSRHALQELHLNQIKAAASPVRKRKSLGAAGSPATPRSHGKENSGSPGLSVIGASNASPMKRVPILANFEEWMKMATDNKINATNSWNFALIDYFHDMSLLKEGDGVNFQKASCTLDGCIKIYTSRVDSVATETGKLLSGLADSGTKKRKGEENDAAGGGEEDDEDGEDEDGVKRKSKKKAQRSSEATLVNSFAQIQLKKMEVEFSVDPLFKKASADFDEGGAKGLLLNHLTIDADGRIVFDSSEDSQEPTEETDFSPAESEEKNLPSAPEQPVNINLDSLAAKFFPDLSLLDNQDICPSFKNFELGGANDAKDIPFLKAPDDWRGQNKASTTPDGLMLSDDGNLGGFDDDDNVDGFDLGANVGFGEGGEAWAKQAVLDHQSKAYENRPRFQGEEVDGMEVGTYEADSAEYGVTLQNQVNDHDNILSYFDRALQKNWAGPEHWRIRKIKDNSKPSEVTTKRKEKEPFEIDFLAPLSNASSSIIHTQAASNTAIILPKTQWRSRTRNLLPDDKHFNSRQLLRLFLKPKARIGARRQGKTTRWSTSNGNDENDAGEIDSAFWARQQQTSSNFDASDEGAFAANYDANFFQDDGLGLPRLGPGDEEDEDFADARETLSPGLVDGEARETQVGIDGLLLTADSAIDRAGSTPDTGFGTQLVTQSRRLRPEYVQYARVAKKVDVRRLKEEMWRGIGVLETVRMVGATQPVRCVDGETQTTAPAAQPAAPTVDEQSAAKAADGATQQPLKFTSIMNSLQSAYPAQAMADISTSYCFICLLHLANEKGLVLENQQGFEEINIARDWTAEVAEVAG